MRDFQLIYRPEAQGVVCGTVYLISLFLFIPIAFSEYLSADYASFPHHRVSTRIPLCWWIVWIKSAILLSREESLIGLSLAQNIYFGNI